MSRLARGDLEVTVEGEARRDELGDMARAVQVFKDLGLEKVRLAAVADAERNRSEEAREQAEAVRSKTAMEQNEVVSAVGAGLERLSAGDLTYQLSTAFPGGYEKLRSDFNGAVRQLQKTMTTVIEQSQRLRSGGHMITQTSDDLARRTEQQAASLEETAAALDEITATVRKTADGANEARKAAAEAKDDAAAPTPRFAMRSAP
jgi:methyl-accepting chemotaxis protein